MRCLVPLAFVAALAILAGCGSSSGDPVTATDAAASGGGSLTKAEFIARADALCEASKAKQEPLRRQLAGVTRTARGEEQSAQGLTDGTRKELAQTLADVVGLAEDGLSRVQALGPPRADAGRFEAILRGFESSFRASLAYGSALERHEDAKAQAVAERANAETRATAALAAQYGFKVCGSQP